MAYMNFLQCFLMAALLCAAVPGFAQKNYLPPPKLERATGFEALTSQRIEGFQFDAVVVGVDKDMKSLLGEAGITQNPAVNDLLGKINGERIQGGRVKAGSVIYVPKTWRNGALRANEYSAELHGLRLDELSGFQSLSTANSLHSVATSLDQRQVSATYSSALRAQHIKSVKEAALAFEKLDKGAISDPSDLNQLVAKAKLIAYLSSNVGDKSPEDNKVRVDHVKRQAANLLKSASEAERASQTGSARGTREIKVNYYQSSKLVSGSRVYAIPMELVERPDLYDAEIIREVLMSLMFPKLTTPTSYRVSFGSYAIYVIGGRTPVVDALSGMVENVKRGVVKQFSTPLVVHERQSAVIELDVKE